MKTLSTKTGLLTLAMLAMPMSLSAQDQTQDQTQGPVPQGDSELLVQGQLPTSLEGLPKGPDIEGIISARSGDRIQVTSEAGAASEVSVGEVTKIKSSGGFLGLNSKQLAVSQLLNGIPVKVKTVQYGGGLIASEVAMKNGDYRVASMIRGGTAQGFAEQTAATEALRGRVGDIDKYNVKGTTNVYFDTGKWVLAEQDKASICQAAQQA